MKNLKILAGLLIFGSTLMISCSKEDNQGPGTNVLNIVNQGNWRFALYNDSGVDETNHYTGYTFTFSNGTVTAVKNASTVTGTYSTIFDDSKNKLVLNFGVTVPFDELNDDWHILEETATRVRLQDVSGGSGQTDLLTFEKN